MNRNCVASLITTCNSVVIVGYIIFNKFRTTNPAHPPLFDMKNVNKELRIIKITTDSMSDHLNNKVSFAKSDASELGKILKGKRV